MNKEEKEDKFSVREILTYIVIIGVILLIKADVVTPIMVSGDSMKTTLLNRDVLILNKLAYKFTDIKRFDIVVIDDNNEYLIISSIKRKKMPSLMKIWRVIGLPGEKVEYKNDQLYINGKRVKEEYAREKTDDFSAEVPEDNYFVLGDNRAVSVDSRYFGSFEKKEILGKANCVIFPFQRFGWKD